jgi:hypothetical protein
MKYVERKVRMVLTEEELIHRRNTFAIEQIRINELRQEKKDMAADYKRRIDQLEDQQALLEEVVKTRTEDRIMKLMSKANFTTGMMEYYDPESSAKVDERPLTAEERQMSLLDEIGTTLTVIPNAGFMSGGDGITAAGT